LLDIVKAGDNTALHKGFGNYPLRVLAPVAAGVGLFGLICARVVAGGPVKHRPPRAFATTQSV
jgi:hypothetical protein